ncbi:hypothetical protein D3C84_705760 [compost metagenome]
MFAGFETFGGAAQRFPTAIEDQILERVVRAGLIIPRIQMNCPTVSADFFPGFGVATENTRQLGGVELMQRIVRMKDDRQAVDGDDLFGRGGFQIAQGFEAGQFAVLDRARRRGKLGGAGFQCSETGAGAVGRHFHDDLASLSGFSHDT